MIQKNKTGDLHKKVNKPLPTMSGLRLTKQRQEVYQVLLEQRDHPTASEVYARVRVKRPAISLATVYNCLDALVAHRIVRQVNFDREPSRFCPNLVEHGHFQDVTTGVIHDIRFREGVCLDQLVKLPDGVNIEEIEITLRGRPIVSYKH